MSIQDDIDALIPDNSTGQVTPLRVRSAFQLVTDDLLKAIKKDGSVQFDPGYVPTLEQDALTKKFQLDQARGFVGKTLDTALNAVGNWVEVVVPMDGDANRQYKSEAKVHFDSNTNVNGEIEYQVIVKKQYQCNR